jgi:hypothetical protein
VKPSYGRVGDAKTLLPQEVEEELVNASGAGSRLLNEFAVIGTHNSIHVAALFSVFIPFWQYSHTPLVAQLEMGLRHIELDIWYNRNRKKWVVRGHGRSFSAAHFIHVSLRRCFTNVSTN